MKKILFIFVLLFPGLVIAKTAGDILQNKLASFQSMQANFQQTIVSDRGDILQKTTGKMAIQRPGKFYWHADQPIEQLILINQEKVYVYDPDLQQATIYPLDKSVSSTPAALLMQSKIYLDKNFQITQIQSKQKGDWFKLIPKNKQEMFSEIILAFDQSQLMQMQLTNALGQHTMIEFSDVQLNPKLNSTLFVFNVPKNVDVIDQTKGV